MSTYPTYTEFAACLGTSFAVQAAVDTPVIIELTKATPSSPPNRPDKPALRQEPFHLLFKGPLQVCLSQQTYELQHDTLGSLLIFLVPVDQDQEGFYYEAVFT